jgi:hypothetical protein
MEITALVCTIVATIIGLWSVFSKSERHLREIRDVLIQIRDQGRPLS